jgi:hypothetical protein
MVCIGGMVQTQTAQRVAQLNSTIGSRAAQSLKSTSGAVLGGATCVHDRAPG